MTEQTASLVAARRALRERDVYLSAIEPTPSYGVVFPGLGSQYVNMLADLRWSDPVVSATFDEADAIFSKRYGVTLSSRIHAHLGGSAAALAEPSAMQGAIFTGGVAQYRRLLTVAPPPKVVLGHSMGEFAAYVAAGLISFADGFEGILARSEEVTAIPPAERGVMAAVMTPTPEHHRLFRRLLLKASTQGSVRQAIVNSPQQTIVSGSQESISRFCAQARERGLATTLLRVSHGFHSPLLARAVEPLVARLSALHFEGPTSVAVVSTITGDWITPEDAPDLPDLLAAELITPFDFPAVLAKVVERGVTNLIDAGPSAIMAKLVDQSGLPLMAVPFDARSRSGEANLRSVSLYLRSLGLIGAATEADAAPVAAPAAPRVTRGLGSAPAAAPAPGVGAVAPTGPAKPDEADLLRCVSLTSGFPSFAIDTNQPLSRLGVSPAVLEAVRQALRDQWAVDLVDDDRSIRQLADDVARGVTWIRTVKAGGTAPMAGTAGVGAISRTVVAPVEAGPPTAVEPWAGGEGAELVAVSAADLVEILTQQLAEATGYPLDIIEPDLDLEADLGIDSVKQAQVIGAVAMELGWPEEPLDLTGATTINLLAERLSALSLEFATGTPALLAGPAGELVTAAPALAAAPAGQAAASTLASEALASEALVGELIDAAGRLLASPARQTSGAPAVAGLAAAVAPSTFALPRPLVAVEAASPASSPVVLAEVDHTQLVARLVAHLVEVTGYPADVVEPDLDLEADLGVDSIKQAQVVGAVGEELGWAPDTPIDLAGALTVNAIADRLLEVLAEAAGQPVELPRVEAAGQPVELPRVEAAGQPAELPSAQAATREAGELLAPVRQAITAGAAPAAEPVAATLDPAIVARAPSSLAPPTAPVSTAAANVADQPDVANAVDRPDVADAADTNGGEPAIEPVIEPTIEARPVVNPHPDLVAPDIARRYILEPLVRPLRPHEIDGTDVTGKVFVVAAADDPALTAEVRQRLEAAGAAVWVADRSLDAAPGDDHVIAVTGEPALMRQRLAQAHLRTGTVDGLVYLTGLTDQSGVLDLPRDAFRAAWQRQLDFMFCLGQEFYADLKAKDKHALVAVATASGGGCGLKLTELGDPMGQLAVGGIKAISHELPGLRKCFVDFNGESRSQAARLLVGEILAATDTNDDEIAYLGDQRHVLRVIPQALPVSPVAQPARRPGVVVFSGGSRGIALESGIRLAEVMGDKVVLLGRSSLTNPESQPYLELDDEAFEHARPALLKALHEDHPDWKPVRLREASQGVDYDRQLWGTLQRLRRQAVEVDYMTCDVADAAQVERTLREIERTKGTIRGIVHGAGIVRPALLPKKELDWCRSLLACKVDGLYNLARAVDLDQLDFFYTYTSLAGHFGMDGQFDYAAASAVASALTSEMAWRHPTLSAVAIDWTAWADAGMALTHTSRHFQEDQRGLRYMSAAEGCDHLLRELMAGGQTPQVLVFGGLGVYEPQSIMSCLDYETLSAVGPLSNGSVVDRGTYPLLDYQLDRTPSEVADAQPGEVVFARRLDPRIDRFMADHLVQGLPTLPGFFHIEVMAEVARLATGWDSVKVDSASFLRFVKCRVGATVDLVIRAAPVGDALQATISADVVDPKGNVLVRRQDRSTGLFSRAQAVEPPVLAEIAAAALGSDRREAFDLDTFYRASERHIAFGPSFRLIEQAWRLDDDRLAGLIRVPTSSRMVLSRGGARLMTEPLLLDNVGRLALIDVLDRSGDRIVPVEVEGMTFYGYPEPGSLVLGIITYGPRDLDPTASVDVMTLDGQHLIHLESLGVRSVGRDPDRPRNLVGARSLN